MPKGIVHLGDVNIAGGDFEKAADGKHKVIGFNYRSVDDKGDPIFKDQLGRMVVQLEFISGDDEKAPMYSATVTQLFALVKAFGAQLPKIEYKNRMTSKTLLSLEALANQAAHPLTVESSNGWVKRIDEAVPPDGIYTVKFVRAHRYDFNPESLEWSESVLKNGAIRQTLMFDFEIVGDMLGKPSIWNGASISIFMNKAHISVSPEGTPCEVLTFPSTQTGGWSKDVRRWWSFLLHFAPSVLDHDWQRDPLKSTYRVDEVDKPQYVIVKRALEDNKSVVVHCKINNGRYEFDLDGDVIVQEEAIVLDEDSAQSNSLYELITYIEKKWSDIKIFAQSDPLKNEVVLTEEGKIWAKTYLGAADEENSPFYRVLAVFPETPRQLASMTEDQVRLLLNEMKSQYGEVNAQDW